MKTFKPACGAIVGQCIRICVHIAGYQIGCESTKCHDTAISANSWSATRAICVTGYKFPLPGVCVVDKNSGVPVLGSSEEIFER